MIIPGLTSVTFRNLTPQKVVQLAKNAGLQGIEWGSDVHVPVGQLKKAELISRITGDAGLKISAYGSYYKVGKGMNKASNFHEVLDTAKSLGAPIIRIWAGEVGSKNASVEDWNTIIEETRVLAYMAGQADICLAFEFHENTINDTYEASQKLLREIDHPCVKTYWQPIHGAGPEVNAAGIDHILQWIIGAHVFHWWPTAQDRLPLQAGAADWKVYLDRLSGIPGTIFGNLEFVKDDSIEQFFEDADSLQQLIRNQQNQERKELMNGNLSRELLS